MVAPLLLLLAQALLVVAAQRKNILFLAVDDLRVQLGTDHVPGTPNMSTPNIDSLVAKSLYLKKAQVQQAVCSPTRTSLLTSRYPDTTRVWDLYSYFRTVGGNYTTIPELFKNNGYHTVGNGKIFHPGHASGAHQQPKVPGESPKGDDAPYSWSETFYHSPNLGYWSSKVQQPGCDRCGNSWIAVTPEAEKKTPLPGQQIADHAISQLESFATQQIGTVDHTQNDIANPFFLAVGFHKPHLPFVAPVSV